MRQLSIEQIETYERQRAAAEKLRTLNEAQAQAAMQTQLTNSRVQVQIAESQGEADLARARKQAEQTVVNAGRQRELAREPTRAQAEQTVVTAEADSQQRVLAGRGEAPARHAGRPVRGVGAAAQDRARSAIRGCTPCRWWPST